MKKSHARLAAAVGFVAAVGLLAGCSGTSGTASTASAGVSGKVAFLMPDLALDAL